MLADQALQDLGAAFDEMGWLIHRRLGTKARFLRVSGGRVAAACPGSCGQAATGAGSVIEAEAITAPPRQTSPS
jgi:hypothetical protein